MVDSIAVLVNHALCDLSIELHAWALASGNHELADRIERWINAYDEVLDLEIALHRSRPEPPISGSEVA